jgi:hypothetical protein
MPVVELILPRQDLQSLVHLIILLAAVLVASTAASRMIICTRVWRSCLGMYTPLMVR